MKIEKGHYVPKELITSEAIHEAVVKCFVAAGFHRNSDYLDYRAKEHWDCIAISGSGVICWSVEQEKPLTLQQLFTAENGLKWPENSYQIVGNEYGVWFCCDDHIPAVISGRFESNSRHSVLAYRQPKEKEASEALDKAVIELSGVYPEPDGNPESPREGVYYCGKLDSSGLHLSRGVGLGGASVCTRDKFTQRAKELGFINGYRFMQENETNGKPNLPGDVMVSVLTYGRGRLPAGYVGFWNWNSSEIKSWRIVDDRYKPADTSYLKPKIVFVGDSTLINGCLIIRRWENDLSKADSLTHSEEGLTHSDWWDYENDKPVSRPPLGTECLCIDQDENQTAFIVGYDFFSDDRIFWRSKKENGNIYYGGLYSFMPLDHATRKAELEKKRIVDAAFAIAPDKHKLEDILSGLYDLGYLRLPEQPK